MGHYVHELFSSGACAGSEFLQRQVGLHHLVHVLPLKWCCNVALVSTQSLLLAVAGSAVHAV
jgi:hypothetical protein